MKVALVNPPTCDPTARFIFVVFFSNFSISFF